MRTRAVPDLRTTELVAVLLTGIASVMTAGLKPILITLYITRTGLDQSLAGFILTAEMLSAAAGAALVSALVISLGRRRLALIGLLLLLFGDVACVTGPSIAPLVVLRAISGLGAGFAAGTMAAALSGTTTPERWMGIYNGIALALIAAVFLVVPAVVDAWGMRAVFAGLAATTLPAIGMLRFFPQSAPAAPADGEPPRVGLPTGATATLLGIFCYYAALGGTWPFMAEIGRGAGWDVPGVSKVLSLAQLAGAAGSFLPALLGARLRRGPALVLAIGTATLALTGLATGDKLIFAFAAPMFVGASMMLFAYVMGVVATIDPVGRVAGLAFATQTVCLGAGPAWAGVTFAKLGGGALIAICIGFAILSLVALAPIAFRQQRRAADHREGVS